MPIFQHDCKKCTFVGTFEFVTCFHNHHKQEDVYICPQLGKLWTMIWRYGDKDPDYTSTPISVLRQDLPIHDASGKLVDTSGACYHYLLADIEDRKLMP